MCTMIGAFFFAPKCSLGYRPLLSGYTIVLYTIVLYAGFSACIPLLFNDMQFVWVPGYWSPSEMMGTLGVCWLAIVLFVGFYQFFSRHRLHRFVSTPLHLPQEQFFPALAYAFVVLGLLFKALFVIRSGGFHNLLLSRSHGIAQSLGLIEDTDRVANYLIQISFIGDAAACWLFLEALRFRKHLLRHGILVFVTVALTFLITPKRLVLMAPLLSLGVGFGIYVRPLQLKYAPIFLFGALTFSMVTLAARIFLPAYLAGAEVLDFARWGLVKKFALAQLSADLGFFDSTAVAVFRANDILAKFDGWWNAFYRPNFEPFLYAIPRFIWPSKPDHLVDVAIAMRAVIFGGTLRSTDIGVGVGLIGTSWLYGAIFGLVAGMAILAWAATFVDRFLEKMHFASPGRILIFASSCTVLFHLYRQGTLGWTFLNFFQTGSAFLGTSLFLIYMANVHNSRSNCHAIGKNDAG